MTYPEAVPPHERTSKLPLIAALVVLLITIGGGLALGLLSHGSGPSYPSAWDPRIAPLAAIAEKDRGLKFLHPVYVDFLSPAEFAKQVTSGAKSLTPQDRKQLADAQGMLRALGVISDKTDLLKEMNTLNSSGILGLYNDEDKRIRVRGTRLTPAVKITLVHELTHVLQDQHYDLTARFQRIDASPTEDSSAFDAVVEGDAVRIENQYRRSLPKSIQRQLDKSDATDQARFGKASKKVPGFLVTEMGAPYALGEIAVTRAANGDGNAGVNALFKTPPTHQIQLLQPWRMGTAWTSPTFAKPVLQRGQTLADRGEFGAFDLYLVLAQRLPVAQALAAADGWGGDQFMSYTSHSRVCIDAAFTGQNTGATSRLDSALTRWAAGSKGTARVSMSGSTITLRACDPGTASAPPTDHSATALDLLATRNGIELQVEKEGAPSSFAACFAQTVAQRFSLAALNADTLPAAEKRQIQQIAVTCRG